MEGKAADRRAISLQEKKEGDCLKTHRGITSSGQRDHGREQEAARGEGLPKPGRRKSRPLSTTECEKTQRTQRFQRITER